MKRLRAAVPLVAVLLATAAPAAAAEIVIGPAALAPSVLRVPLHGRVTFVNRSGEVAHVEFEDREGGHHTYQVPGQVYAEFHRPGRHLVLVHVGGGRPRELRGVIHVEYEPANTVVPGECGGIAVEGACLER